MVWPGSRKHSASKDDSAFEKGMRYHFGYQRSLGLVGNEVPSTLGAGRLEGCDDEEGTTVYRGVGRGWKGASTKSDRRSE